MTVTTHTLFVVSLPAVCAVACLPACSAGPTCLHLRLIGKWSWIAVLLKGPLVTQTLDMMVRKQQHHFTCNTRKKINVVFLTLCNYTAVGIQNEVGYYIFLPLPFLLPWKNTEYNQHCTALRNETTLSELN